MRDNEREDGPGGMENGGCFAKEWRFAPRGADFLFVGRFRGVFGNSGGTEPN